MIKPILTFIALITLVFYLISCGDDPPPPGGGGNETDPGILFTDEFGNITGGDTTDWCLNNVNGFSFGPAFPNPTTANSIGVKLQTPVADTIKIYFLRNNIDTVIFYDGIVNPGAYTFQYLDSMSQFANSYQRLHLRSKHFAASQYCRFYGDVKFEP